MLLLVGCVVAEDSLMQFEKASDLEHVQEHGAERVNKMKQSATAMEEQWRGLVANVAESNSWTNPATGNPWVPDKELVLDPVKNVIDQMREQLVGQKDLNTWIMGNHTAEIAACNAARETALTGTVIPLKTAMIAARDAHAGCRGEENTAISAMEAQCKKFNDLSTPTCTHEQDWFAAFAEGVEGPNTLKELVANAASCKADIASTKTKAEECDGKQTSFTSAFCDYATELDLTCSAHDDCYSTQTGNWGLANGSIQKLEDEQKTIFRMLGRIECYLNLLFAKKDNVSAVPTQADITTCEKTAQTDTPLDVTYGVQEEKGLCKDDLRVSDESSANKPGSDLWYTKEFLEDAAIKLHGKLNANTQTC